MKMIPKVTLLATSVLILASGAAAQEETDGDGIRPRREMRQEHRAARQARHQEILKIYDENGDGKLDDVERSVLRDDVRAGKISPPPRPRGAGPWMRRGPGHPPAEIVAAYDADGDGKLDEAERGAVRADIEAGKLAPPRRGGGPGPRGPVAPAEEPEAEE